MAQGANLSSRINYLVYGEMMAKFNQMDHTVLIALIVQYTTILLVLNSFHIYHQVQTRSIKSPMYIFFASWMGLRRRN